MNDSAATSHLTLGQATEIAHALSASLGESLRARVLTIKGPAAQHHGLRPARIAADADILVEPARFDDLCVALESHGWRERVARETPALLDAHSRTYIHDAWSCDIDVHRWFPGFFGDPGTVFDELWRSRCAILIGSVPVMIPSRAATAVIAAMHALRNISVPRHAQEWEWVRTALREDFSEQERQEFIALTTIGRARWVLREQLRDITGLEPEDDLTTEQRRAWQAHIDFAADGGAAGWWIALRRKPLLARPMFLARAVWVPRAAIPRNDESVLPTHREAWAYQAARWGRGVSATVKYMRRSDQ